MSPFEITMLVCFGASWPFSILRVWRTRSATGKSIVFLTLVLVGYIAGITHKILYATDPVVALYALNAVMVSIDLGLSIQYRGGPPAVPVRAGDRA